MSDLWHKYVDFFVEPLKKVLPWRVPFFRTDNKEGFLAWREKPLGYWVGHAVAYAVVAVVVYAIYLWLTASPKSAFPM